MKASLDLKSILRQVKDFPKEGINFIDITTMLKDNKAFRQAIDQLGEMAFTLPSFDLVVGAESRGFIFGAPLAYALGKGFVPIRKKGKLPYKTVSVSYELEYGVDTLEMHEDAITPGQSVLIVDDLLATGGTAGANVRLVEKLGGRIAGLAFFVELSFLAGRERLKGYEVRSLVTY